jgi:cyanophycinase
LLQRFWEDGGAYGARLVLLPTDGESKDLAARFSGLLREWEAEQVTILPVESRETAMKPEGAAQIEGATGILLLGGNPVRLATMLGGTPLAQAIRRANARGRAVGGWGRAAAILCEHMIAFDTASDQAHQPFLYRHLIQFAPGLGITNRLVLDTTPSQVGSAWNRLARLLNAVAYNPFLIGVGMEWETGAVIYPDNTLEVVGNHSALVVDGAGLSHTDIHEFRRSSPLSLLGVKLHVLGPTYTFNLQSRTAHPPATSDIPDTAVPEGD